MATSRLPRFFALAFALAWLVTIPIALQTQGIVPRIMPPALQWLIGFAPAVAAVLVARGTPAWPAFAAAAVRFRVGGRWYLLALLTPWVLLGLTVLIRKMAHLAPVSLSAGPATLALSAAWLVLAWGEEVGWRGFALPELVRRRGFGGAVLILGVLWCVWHYPKLLASPYLRLDAQGLGLLGRFSLQIVVANVLLCWLFFQTRSAPIATLFHASFNTVATMYSAAATDPVFTGCLIALTGAALRIAPPAVGPAPDPPVLDGALAAEPVRPGGGTPP
jgi:uncharacterized protein